MSEGVRLDRWLWAARFFKTRAQAKAAIEGGKIDFHLPTSSEHSQTIKPKVSKEVAIGDTLTVRKGWSEQTVFVRDLSNQRGNASSAQLLYEETLTSIEARETQIARRKMERAGLQLPANRPNKRDRRELMKLKDEQP